MLQDSRIILDTPKVFALTVSLSLLCIVSEKIFFGLCKLVMIVSSKCRRHICDGAFAVMSSDSDTSVFLKPKDLQTASLPDTAVNIKNLSFSYKTETVERKIFSDFSIDFESHKKTAIVSPTGSGKTTLLKILSGIIPSSQWTGTVLCPEVSVIFQEDRLVLGITVLKNVALPLFSIMKKEDAYKRAFYY